MYEGKVKGGGIMGRLAVKWIKRVTAYWSERVGSSRIECAVEREGQNREGVRHLCHVYSSERSSHEGGGHWRCR